MYNLIIFIHLHSYNHHHSKFRKFSFAHLQLFPVSSPNSKQPLICSLTLYVSLFWKKDPFQKLIQLCFWKYFRHLSPEPYIPYSVAQNSSAFMRRSPAYFLEKIKNKEYKNFWTCQLTVGKSHTSFANALNKFMLSIMLQRFQIFISATLLCYLSDMIPMPQKSLLGTYFAWNCWEFTQLCLCFILIH